MSDIELVIKINEDVWKRICGNQSVPDMLNIDIVNGLNAIKNGTPLPKGHDRLIDADWVKNTLDIYVINEYNGQFIRRNDIDTIPTVIEGSDEE